MPQPLHERLKAAIAALDINTPIRRVDDHGEDGLTLHLPHKVVQWCPVVPRPEPSGEESVTTEAKSDDLTAIPGIGDISAQRLKNAGILNFKQLCTTDYAQLVDIVGTQATNKIADYFTLHYP